MAHEAQAAAYFAPPLPPAVTPTNGGAGVARQGDNPYISADGHAIVDIVWEDGYCEDGLQAGFPCPHTHHPALRCFTPPTPQRCAATGSEWP